MASGQGPGPPRQECGEPALPSASEEQVARDTEEVFRSYVFYRHQQEQEAEGAAAPADPEMDTLPLQPSSTMGQVGRQLAIIGDDINRRYDSEFQTMLQHLQPTAENAYEYFTKIASSLFESGINWGRVVALLGFGYRLALHVYQHGLTGFLGQVTRFVVDFMLHHCIARWIAQRGGSPELGQWSHPERAGGSGCGSVGPVCGTKILQIMTPKGALWGPSSDSCLDLSQVFAFSAPLQGSPLKSTEALASVHSSFGGPLCGGQSGCRGASTLHGASGPSLGPGAVASSLGSLGPP
uniref:Bcl-2 homologous antagonist/killer n=1 Tax=Macaca fascicularis TaxID=9541 RepID=A0A2K5UMM2_MACFA